MQIPFIEPSTGSSREAVNPMTELKAATGFSSYQSYLESYRSHFPDIDKIRNDLSSVSDSGPNQLMPNHCTMIDVSKKQDLNERLNVRLNLSSDYEGRREGYNISRNPENRSVQDACALELLRPCGLPWLTIAFELSYGLCTMKP